MYNSTCKCKLNDVELMKMYRKCGRSGGRTPGWDIGWSCSRLGTGVLVMGDSMVKEQDGKANGIIWYYI